MKQVYNPYLPLDTYIPDGEPHVFDDRIYIFGSHDKEGGDAFCLLDYECWSAPIDDLTDWRCDGTIYKAIQDPDYSETLKSMYAPDVVKGNDGRYYLYYALGGARFGDMSVVVCDTPCGKYEYIGKIRKPDGSVLTTAVPFDPAVINDDGTIRLYYGWSLPAVGGFDGGVMSDEMKLQFMYIQKSMFKRTDEDINECGGSIFGAFTAELSDDMITVKETPKRIIPGYFESFGTSFEGHAFFEASSMRKVGEKYYFIYSSSLSHELCYATSDFPDKDFVYGGTIISNGDIGLNGINEDNKLATTGNNHGSIVKVKNDWYIFYHRQTNKTAFSRQGCAEKIRIEEDGSIKQVEMTSCGLNGKPLVALGIYPAVIACNLYRGHMPHTEPNKDPNEFKVPYMTYDGENRIIKDIDDQTTIVYKYLEFTQNTRLSLVVKSDSDGIFNVYIGDNEYSISVSKCDDWTKMSCDIDVKGAYPLKLCYVGNGKVSLKEIEFGR